jgi:hypothetical protein
VQLRTRGSLVAAVIVAFSVCAPLRVAASGASDASAVFSSTPLGRCSVIAPVNPSYRNTTGNTANTYHKIGTSGEGRSIWAEHWGKVTGPQVLVIGQIHGDECSPAFLVEALRKKPATSFGVWLIPTLNPDALANGTRLTPGGIDINRDGYRLQSPETRALMNFTRSIKPVLSVHIHAPYGFVGSRNGGTAAAVANAIAKSASWGQGQGSGTLAGSRSGRAFLWDGQERVLAKHRSVLIELPATSRSEASGAPQPERLVLSTPARLRALSVRIRDAMYSALAVK